MAGLAFVGEGRRGGVLLNVELVQRQLVHEGLHQVVCGEVEDQAEKDGDGQSGERFLEDGEEEQGQTQALRGHGRTQRKPQGANSTQEQIPLWWNENKRRRTTECFG